MSAGIICEYIRELSLNTWCMLIAWEDDLPVSEVPPPSISGSASDHLFSRTAFSDISFRHLSPHQYDVVEVCILEQGWRLANRYDNNLTWTIPYKDINTD